MKHRIIVMLGAQMRGAGEAWTFPYSVTNPDGTEVLSGGSSRMRAIQLATASTGEIDKRGVRILVTGGQEASGESRSAEAARQLLADYGIPAGCVEALRGRGNTEGNVEAVASYITRHANDFADVHALEIVTNEFHMLRAWLMFQQGFYALQYGTRATVSLEDVGRITAILEESLRANDEELVAQIPVVRKRIMTILAPYFNHIRIQAVPVVVEDVLDMNGGDAERKYAAKLRYDHRMRGMITSEYQGVTDYLHGSYHSEIV